MQDRAEEVAPRLQRLRIWDLPTRLFHWLLVGAVAACAYTGFLGPANLLHVHVWAGYAIAALVLWRLVWGLLGSEFSRIDRLTGALPKLGEHARGLVRLSPKHYIGHNPAGSLMILALLLVLASMCATGLMVLGGGEKQGPLAGLLSWSFGHTVKGVHKILAYLLLAMIVGHLAGVVAETVLLRVSLVRGMITGWLPLPEGEIVSVLRRPRPVSAALTVIVLAGVVGAALVPLYAMPPLGVPAPVPTSGTYSKECSACHWAFHPSLLPRQSWKALMASLDDHFGEDASLPEKTATEITDYLVANAAETADTEPANRAQEVSADPPRRVTEFTWWKRQHHELPDSLFKSATVKSRANCAACHHDASTGRFDDQQISIPRQQSAGALP